MEESFHHFVVVPSNRPEAIHEFLQSYKTHLFLNPIEANRVHFVIINGGAGKRYTDLELAVNRFKLETPEMNIHLFGNEWKNQFLEKCERKRIPKTVRKFLTDISFSQLRNLGHFASLSLAKKLVLDAHKTLIHQTDDDVRPEYVPSSSKSREPLPFSIFTSSENAFRENNAAVLNGRYSGHIDYRSYTPMVGAAAHIDNLHKGKVTPLGLVKDASKTADFFGKLARGINEGYFEPSKYPPDPSDFSYNLSNPPPEKAEANGGARVIRLSHFGLVPPTPFRGEDLFQLAELLQRNGNDVRYAPDRKLLHLRHVDFRDQVSTDQSDFFHDVLIRTVEPFLQTAGFKPKKKSETEHEFVTRVVKERAEELFHEIAQYIPQFRRDPKILFTKAEEAKKSIERLEEIRSGKGGEKFARTRKMLNEGISRDKIEQAKIGIQEAYDAASKTISFFQKAQRAEPELIDEILKKRVQFMKLHNQMLKHEKSLLSAATNTTYNN
ncbi:hypothetical protein HY994_04145 [Candidatus Micrarchaeota archaeon]|nr:hypothetical protein [Candidatus Micrarchaeota archaeon]